MSVRYADTSAIARAYLPDEPEHARFRAMLLDTDEQAATSELARLELASAIRSAGRSGRAHDWRGLLAQIDEDCRGDGPLRLVELHPKLILPRAYDLVLEHGLRTLDAIHLAVALEEGRTLAGDDELIFVTRDRDQAAAAAALGLAVA